MEFGIPYLEIAHSIIGILFQNNKRYMRIQLTYSKTVFKFMSGLGFQMKNQ